MDKYIKELLKLLNEMRLKLSGMKISVSWAISVFVIFIGTLLRFVLYAYEMGKCTFWKVPISAIKISENNIFEFLCLICIALLLIIYGFVIYKTISSSFELFISNKSVKYFLISLVIMLTYHLVLYFVMLVVASLLIIGLSFDSILNLVIVTLVMHVLIFIYCLAIFISRKIVNNKKKINSTRNNNFSITDLIIILIVFPIMISCIFAAGYNSQTTKDKFKLINNYVVIYENDDFFYLANFDNNSNIINPNKQKIISSINCEYEIIELSHFFVND